MSLTKEDKKWLFELFSTVGHYIVSALRGESKYFDDNMEACRKDYTK